MVIWLPHKIYKALPNAHHCGCHALCLVPCYLKKEEEIRFLESDKAQGRDLARRANVLVRMGRASLLSPPCGLGANKAEPQMQNAGLGACFFSPAEFMLNSLWAFALTFAPFHHVGQGWTEKSSQLHTCRWELHSTRSLAWLGEGAVNKGR